jgi:hypothetical protein
MKPMKFCVNSGFFGRRRDRFTEYQPDRTLPRSSDWSAASRG